LSLNFTKHIEVSLIKEACTQHIHQINLTDLKESTNFTDKLKIKGNAKIVNSYIYLQFLSLNLCRNTFHDTTQI